MVNNCSQNILKVNDLKNLSEPITNVINFISDHEINKR